MGRLNRMAGIRLKIRLGGATSLSIEIGLESALTSLEGGNAYVVRQPKRLESHVTGPLALL